MDLLLDWTLFSLHGMERIFLPHNCNLLTLHTRRYLSNAHGLGFLCLSNLSKHEIPTLQIFYGSQPNNEDSMEPKDEIKLIVVQKVSCLSQQLASKSMQKT
ncbi:hypothetical protein Ancab_005336 [Ancistrocladus abbreviatus]